MSMTTEQVWEAFHVPLQQFIRRRIADETTVVNALKSWQLLPERASICPEG